MNQSNQMNQSQNLRDRSPGTAQQRDYSPNDIAWKSSYA